MLKNELWGANSKKRGGRNTGGGIFLYAFGMYSYVLLWMYLLREYVKVIQVLQKKNENLWGRFSFLLLPIRRLSHFWDKKFKCIGGN